jgi:hypothetical protein
VLTVATATGAFTDKNVATGKTVNITGIALGGADAGNYTLSNNSASATANITPASIAGVTGITASDKVYDGTTVASLNTGGASFTGRLGADVLTVATATGAFTDKNVATGKIVNITGITLGGADAGNYTLSSNSASATANITPASIARVTGITASDKVYDGTTAASLNTAGALFVGALGSDVLNIATSTGAFGDKHVGAGKPVSITGITLGGTDAVNYVLTNTTATAMATITPRPISVSAMADTKIYDGTTTSVAVPVVSAGAIATGDTAAFVQAFADPTAGSSKLLFLNGFVLDGRGGANYAVTFVPASAGTITPRPVTLTPTAGLNKFYGEADPTLTYAVTSGNLVGTDTLSGALSRLTGENAGAYAITQGTLVNSNYAVSVTPGAFTINPRPITLAATDQVKIYGAVDPALTFSVGGMGLAAGDATAGVFSGALTRVAGESVAGGPYTISQGTVVANANYRVTGFATGQFTITPALLTVTANDASRPTFTPNPSFSARYSGFVAGDGLGNLGGTLAFATPATVSSPPGVYSITPSGLVSSNYTIRYGDGKLDVQASAPPLANTSLLMALDQVAPAGGVGGGGSTGVTLRSSADIGGECVFLAGRFFDCRITSRVAAR